MTGPPAVLVDSHSATHGRPYDSEHHRNYPIDRTHSDLVKFSSAYDETYIMVLGYLRSLNIEVRNARRRESQFTPCLECLITPNSDPTMYDITPTRLVQGGES